MPGLNARVEQRRLPPGRWYRPAQVGFRGGVLCPAVGACETCRAGANALALIGEFYALTAALDAVLKKGGGGAFKMGTETLLCR